MANKSKAELLEEAKSKGIAVTGEETRTDLLKLLDESEKGDQDDDNDGVESDEDAEAGVHASGADIEGDESDHVAVEYFHQFLRQPTHRVFSRKTHGDGYKELATSFSKANPWPALNSAGLVLPAGAKPKAERENRLRFVDESEAGALEGQHDAKFAAINARRDEQHRKGHKVTP